MEFRKVFDTIPDKFDKWRPRYCTEVFTDIIQYSKLDPNKKVLEIGPGTGQATEPILKTGCNYLGIELGEHLAEFTRNKYKKYENLHIVNVDFETYDFGDQKFDLIYSAATIQWIPEQIGFPRVSSLSNNGTTIAMMMTQTDERKSNEELYLKIQNVYDKYYHPEVEYTCHLNYENIQNYGFTDFESRNYHTQRIFTADEYVSYIGTHCTHIRLKEPDKSKFYNGIKEAIHEYGNKITLDDTIILYLARKKSA